LIEQLIRIAESAAEVLRKETEFVVDWKGENDPVTTLDRAINTLICEALEKSFPKIPIVAEESAAESWEARKNSSEVFFVDPIDGTRELIARNGEFSVMIGAAKNGAAIAGVVAWPRERRTFAADEHGAFEIALSERRPLRVVPAEISRARALLSRSHRDPKTLALVARAGVRTIDVMGSAGLKCAMIAAGEAHAYVHLGKCGKLWDACAPDAIVTRAGGRFCDARGDSVDYRGTLALENGLIAGEPTLVQVLLSALQS